MDERENGLPKGCYEDMRWMAVESADGVAVEKGSSISDKESLCHWVWV